MDVEISTGSAFLWALGRATQHGNATRALAASGIDLPELDRLGGASTELGKLIGRSSSTDSTVREAIALGLLAGQVAYQRPRPRRLQDPTSFLMDRDLVVQGAQGESILRLPWFEEGLFVGRQLPDIHEMPSPIRKLCVDTYSAGFSGERGSFGFTSYGHTYSVDAVPVRASEGGRVEAVLAVATPVSGLSSAAAAYERMAERLDSFAVAAEERARRSIEAGCDDSSDQQAARRARVGAERCRANARQIRSCEAGRLAGSGLITSRQIEILEFASHGLTTTEIAAQLNVSSSTVKTHFENIYSRLHVSDRSAAVAVALRHGLIE